MAGVYIYIDGFNLFYGSIKGTPYKWLDLNAFCQRLTPSEHQLLAVKYFTARVVPTRDDPAKPARQDVYIRALRTLPNLTVVFGQFRTRPVPMVRSGSNPPKWVTVDKTEEKGSDVNLASHLLMDGFRGRYELAVVISNDSDLAEPVRMVRRELNLPIGVWNPHPKNSFQLSQHTIFNRKVRPADLAAAQFPPCITDAKGNSLTKPTGW
jgi:hypothetical protein